MAAAFCKAMDAIAEIDQSIAPTGSDGSSSVKVTPVPKGAYVAGHHCPAHRRGEQYRPDPLDAAQQAADRGVRVYTIGFGTANGSEFPHCPRQFLGNEPFGGGMFGGSGSSVEGGLAAASLAAVGRRVPQGNRRGDAEADCRV